MVPEPNRSLQIKLDSKQNISIRSVSCKPEYQCSVKGELIPNISTVDEEEVERLNQQRAKLAEQRQQLETEIQRLSQAAKSDRPEQERLNKLEVRFGDEVNTTKCLILALLGRTERSEKGHPG